LRALLACGQSHGDVEPPVRQNRHPRVSVHVARAVNQADIVTLDLALAPAVSGDENRIADPPTMSPSILPSWMRTMVDVVEHPIVVSNSPAAIFIHPSYPRAASIALPPRRRKPARFVPSHHRSFSSTSRPVRSRTFGCASESRRCLPKGNGMRKCWQAALARPVERSIGEHRIRELRRVSATLPCGGAPQLGHLSIAAPDRSRVSARGRKAPSRPMGNYANPLSAPVDSSTVAPHADLATCGVVGDLGGWRRGVRKRYRKCRARVEVRPRDGPVGWRVCAAVCCGHHPFRRAVRARGRWRRDGCELAGGSSGVRSSRQ
jgi:hypothetical protein